jgi:hypothetical protein
MGGFLQKDPSYEKIKALSALKSILKLFVDELQERAGVFLKLELLKHKTRLAIMSTF